MTIHLGPLAVMTWRRDAPRDVSGFWVRLFGYGVWVGQHRDERRGSAPYFSERFSGMAGVPSRLFVHYGQWCIHPLRRRT